MKRASHSAIVLPVVLVIVGLLALVMAGFTFFVRAELSKTQALRDGRQADLAAESGLQEVIAVLRASPHDRTLWYDVPDQFRHALVWAESYDRDDDPVREQGSREEVLLELTPVPAWRFSVVAPKYDDDFYDTMRYGITPESSKLNINAASEEEIQGLVEPLLLEMGVENTSELIAALLDWLDEDDEERTGGAESIYYNTLEPGYHAKNGPVDTIEELLWVKGFSAAILYGEDVNRNGILDDNEDDAEETFPFYDNGDGVLQLGIAPFLTVWSQEPGSGDGGGAEGGGAGAQEGDEAGQSSGAVIGRVNVNTAPRQVLAALEGMTPEAAEGIVAMRDELDAESLQDAQWPVTSGAVDAATYDSVKSKLTTKSFQFHVEIVGYGDHVRLRRRHEWIIDMRGPIGQVLYHRDLTRLGAAWPIDDDTIVVESQ